MAQNKSLALPYLLPFALYTGVASIPETWLGIEANYIARMVLAGGALAWAWNKIDAIRGPNSWLVSAAAGVAAGLLGTVVWVSLKLPFTGVEGTAWSDRAFWLRVAASGLLVPVFEELALRSFAMRFAFQWGRARDKKSKDAFGDALDASIHALPLGAASRFAIIVATVAFTVSHALVEWPAAIAYGLLMAALWIWRRDLVGCIVAHATTNLSLAWFVRHQGAWDLW
ncbi:MAG: CPBP family glutamic-type intramembrane protease [Planctomycetota bacterium]|nr:CPBP family glutamic-type intramembrane protease [Planctomycetota bacterium]